ncbi:MAG: hypothetical protein K1X65_25285 [Caldilineales bacterium]|nr:hypothetical protein [Caldilineales bacterium]
MKAHPGAELACRAHNLPPTHSAAPRGVISYYATAALATATTLDDWLNRFSSLVRQDVDAGRLPRFYQPDLHLLGDSYQPAPGTTGLP